MNISPLTAKRIGIHGGFIVTRAFLTCVKESMINSIKVDSKEAHCKAIEERHKKCITELSNFLVEHITQEEIARIAAMSLVQDLLPEVTLLAFRMRSPEDFDKTIADLEKALKEVDFNDPAPHKKKS